MAHYGIITSSPRLDAVLTFVDDSTPQAADDWSVGEVSLTCNREGVATLAAPALAQLFVQVAYLQKQPYSTMCQTVLLSCCQPERFSACLLWKVQPLSAFTGRNASNTRVHVLQVGGFEAYLLADEEEEQSGAAAVYRQVRVQQGQQGSIHASSLLR